MKNHRTLLVFISTYEDATPPPAAQWFYRHVQETATDFRVSKNELSNLKFAVFGCGNSLYQENFNKVSIIHSKTAVYDGLFRWLKKLTDVLLNWVVHVS